MNTSDISPSDKIDLDQITLEFIQYVNENSPNLSTDPNIQRVKIIRPNECG